MSGRLTLWGASELLRTFFGKTSQAPETFYLALIKDLPPTPYTSGTELDEPATENSYARVAIPNTATTWDDLTDSLHVVMNTIDLEFVTASADWGRIAYWAICSEAEGGELYFVGNMEEELYVYAEDQALVPAGTLVIDIGPFFTDDEF